MPPMTLLPGPGDRTGLPNLMPRNMYAEGSRTEPGGIALIGRPRLQNAIASSVEANPTNAVFQEAGVLSGALVRLVGESLYISGEGDVGTVSGISLGTFSMAPSIAGNEVGVVVTAGEDAKFWDGTTFRSIAFPDSADVTKVLEHQGRFLFLRADTHQYYWTEPLSNMLDGSGDIVISGSDFASAEGEPDPLVDALISHDQLVLAGSRTIELHNITGNDNLPYSQVLGGTIPYGVWGTGFMTKWNGSFAWLSNEGIVWLYNGTPKPTRLSSPGMERAILVGQPDGLDSFTYEGHEFLRVKGVSSNDYLLDTQSGEWSKWDTDGTAFVGGPALTSGANVEFGSIEEGRMVVLTSSSLFFSGAPETSVTYGWYSGLPVDGGEVVISNILLRCKADEATDVQLRTSNDKGETWSSYRAVTMGEVRTKVEWRSLGQFDQPGFLAQFEAEYQGIHPTFYVSGAYFNEFVRGRGR